MVPWTMVLQTLRIGNAASLCRETPGSFKPMIRSAHEHVDLRGHVDPLQESFDDFSKVSNPSKKMGQRTSIDDYIQLLHNTGPFSTAFHPTSRCKVARGLGLVAHWAKTSMARLRADGTSGGNLAQWHSLIDKALITPCLMSRRPRPRVWARPEGEGRRAAGPD